MALFRKLFYRKPPDGLLEICERVYVFDSCFTTEAFEEQDCKGYVGRIISQLKEHYPDAAILAFNFRDGEMQSEMGNALTEYDTTIMEYPRQYEGCPLLPMEVLHHFLRSSESWLTLGSQNVLFMHCERGGWPVLAFMLAALLIYRKYYSGELRTLDMVYKQAPRELLELFSPLNPIPSQLRYLQYVSRRNVASEWPPVDRALTLDCVIIRTIPNFDGEGGCQPIFRIYGQDPLHVSDRSPKVLFSTPKKSKAVRNYKQAECQLLKIDISCHTQGDVVMECIDLRDDTEREQMIFRVMFNTAFIRSNILILNRDEIDILWDAKDQFLKDFRAEVLFSEMDTATSVAPVDYFHFEEKDGLPLEAFGKVQEMFSGVDWLVPKGNTVVEVSEQPHAEMSQKNQSPSATDDVGRKQAYAEPSPSGIGAIISPENTPSPTDNHILSSSTLPPHQSSDRTVSNFSTKLPLDSDGHLAKDDSTQSDSNPSHPKTYPPTPPPLPTKDTVDGPGQPLTPPAKDKISAQSGISHASLLPEETPISSTSSLMDESSRSHGKIIRDKYPKSGAPPSKDIMENSVSTDSGANKSGPYPAPPPPPPDQSSSVTEVGILPPAVPEPPSTSPLKGQFNSEATPPPPSTPPLRDTSVTKDAPSPPQPPPESLKKSSNQENPSLPQVSTYYGMSAPPPLPPPPVDPHLRDTSAIRLAPHPPTPPPQPLPPPIPTKSSTSSPPPAPPLQPINSPSLAPPAPPPPASTKSPTLTPPPPPPPPPGTGESTTVAPPPTPPPGQTAPPPPPPPALANASNTSSSPSVPSAPPPPFPSTKQPGSLPGVPSPPPPAIPPPGAKGKSALSRSALSKNSQTKKLKPLHWLKISRAVSGSLWAEAQKSGEAAKAPEIDMSELESLFSAAAPNADQGRKPGSRASGGQKSEKVQLIDHRRAYNCEIMLSKVKVPLHEMLSSVLALDDSALDADQVDNLIKFCPTKEEMEMLKGYKGEKDKLGKCEQFFLELMQVPRIEYKLRVFSFKIQFQSQVSELRNSLNIVTSATDQIKGSAKLKRVMQTILSLGNALNQGTARGSAVGFRLDSLLKLTETRARNNKMTLMHYLCKVLNDKLPELLDFWRDLSSLEPASKVQLKFLAEEMQAINKGLEKIVQELSMSENDGPVSDKFRTALKEFLCFAEGEVRSLASLYSGVGRNVDLLILYFGEDPARCPFEQVVSTLVNFVRMFKQAHEENLKQQELDKKKAEKEASEKPKMNTPDKEISEKLKMNTSNREASDKTKIETSEKEASDISNVKTSDKEASDNPKVNTSENKASDKPNIKTSDKEASDKPKMNTSENEASDKPNTKTSDKETSDKPKMNTSDNEASDKLNIKTSDKETSDKPKMNTSDNEASDKLNIRTSDKEALDKRKMNTSDKKESPLKSKINTADKEASDKPKMKTSDTRQLPQSPGRSVK
ncbi:formin-like protein 13 isoform X3 [Andrographis paniculata]|uniref:formin-like protein 13 isoform X3 n=1 Tax=Andrographis paniculata TaxID=175694 RepID=UPI0021E7FF0E|nr:formin-like protein 13 isoform X3 [Andrographis paniculata]